MPTMATRKKHPAKRPTKPLNVHARVTQEHVDALEILAERNRRTRSTEIVIAIESHLATAGLWPLSISNPPE